MFSLQENISNKDIIVISVPTMTKVKETRPTILKIRMKSTSQVIRKVKMKVMIMTMSRHAWQRIELIKHMANPNCCISLEYCIFHRVMLFMLHYTSWVSWLECLSDFLKNQNCCNFQSLSVRIITIK